MFGVFLFLYSVIVHRAPYLVYVYTTSSHAYNKFVIFCSKIFSRNIIYMAKQRLPDQLVYIYMCVCVCVCMCIKIDWLFSDIKGN